MVQLITSRRVRARKPHRCQACTAVAVQPGEEYTRETYAYDGQVYRWVMCDPCREAAEYVWSYSSHPEEGIGWPEYMDWAEDHSVHAPTEPERAAARAYLARAGSYGDAVDTTGPELDGCGVTNHRG